MKRDFCFQTDLPIVGKELTSPGMLELSGTATCTHPKDTDSYDYTLTDVVLIKNGVRHPFYDIIASLSNGEPCQHSVIKPAIEAHMLWLFGTTDAPEATDNRQEPNIFGHCDSDSAIPLNSEPIVSAENHAA